VTDPDMPQAAVPVRTNLWKELFSQANITTGLAVFAVVLASAPYVVPQVQSFVVEHGMMNRPAMLETASNKLSAQREEERSQALKAGIKSHHDSLFNDKTDPVLGNPNAPIKIVEFLDYYCGYCRASTPALKDFLAENPDVAIIVKEYPVIGQNSRPLAARALAASRLGHYEAVHYAFMTETIKSEGDLDAALIKSGVDPKQILALASSPDIQAHIDRVIALGADIGATGTPTFVIGDQAIDGAKIDALKAAVVAARAANKS
jgi:protein-disulfide isomerase